MKTEIRNKKTVSVESIDFEIIDEKGRKVGANISLGTCDIVQLPEDAEAWNNFDTLGFHFWAYVGAARDGVDYGASNLAEYFQTDTARQNWIDDRVLNMKKRYSKKYSRA